MMVNARKNKLPMRRQRREASDKETIEQKPEQSEGASQEAVWENGILGLREQQTRRSLARGTPGLLAGGWDCGAKWTRKGQRGEAGVVIKNQAIPDWSQD